MLHNRLSPGWVEGREGRGEGEKGGTKEGKGYPIHGQGGVEGEGGVPCPALGYPPFPFPVDRHTLVKTLPNHPSAVIMLTRRHLFCLAKIRQRDIIQFFRFEIAS